MSYGLSCKLQTITIIIELFHEEFPSRTQRRQNLTLSQNQQYQCLVLYIAHQQKQSPIELKLMIQRSKSMKQPMKKKRPMESKPGSKPISTLARFQSETRVNFKKATAERQSAEEQKKIRQKQQNRQNYFACFIHYKVIQHFCYEVITKSIKYFVQLVKDAEQNNQFQRTFTMQSITQNFLSVFSNKSHIFFKYSMPLLNNQISKILQSYEETSLQREKFCKQKGIQIRYEILAYVFKCYYYFYQYMPIQHRKLGCFRLDTIYKKLKITGSEFYELKRLFLDNIHRIEYLQFLDVLHSITILINTYLLLLFRQKIIQYQLGTLQPQEEVVEKAIEKQRIQIQMNEEEKGRKLIFEESIFLSALYENYLRQKKKLRVPTFSELTDIVQTFEGLIQKRQDLTKKHPVFKQLGQKYKSEPFEYYRKFKRYEDTKVRLLQAQGSDLSRYKNAAITHYIHRNPSFTYKQLCKSLYMNGSLWIDRDFYEKNITEIIKKEAQYQQIKYLGKIFKGMREVVKDGGNFAFADTFSICVGTELDATMAFQKISLIIVATFTGQLMWKFVPQNMAPAQRMQESQELLSHMFNTPLLLFDPHFPMLDKQKPVQFRRYMMSLLVPKVPSVPNPIEAISTLIKARIQKIFSGSEMSMYSLKDFAQQFMKALKVEEVRQIILNQWQKSQRLIFSGTDPKVSSEKRKKSNLFVDKFGELSIEGTQRKMQATQFFDQSEEPCEDQKQKLQIDQIQSEEGIIEAEPDDFFLSAVRNLQGKDKNQMQEVLKCFLQLNNSEFLYFYKQNKSKFIRKGPLTINQNTINGRCEKQ